MDHCSKKTITVETNVNVHIELPNETNDASIDDAEAPITEADIDDRDDSNKTSVASIDNLDADKISISSVDDADASETGAEADINDWDETQDTKDERADVFDTVHITRLC